MSTGGLITEIVSVWTVLSVVLGVGIGRSIDLAETRDPRRRRTS